MTAHRVPPAQPGFRYVIPRKGIEAGPECQRERPTCQVKTTALAVCTHALQTFADSSKGICAWMARLRIQQGVARARLVLFSCSLGSNTGRDPLGTVGWAVLEVVP